MLFSPTTPTHIALPLHEHQPLLLQEAAGLRTWAFYGTTAHPAVRVGPKQDRFPLSVCIKLTHNQLFLNTIPNETL
jgi:hypothetical protein